MKGIVVDRGSYLKQESMLVREVCQPRKKPNMYPALKNHLERLALEPHAVHDLHLKSQGD